MAFTLAKAERLAELRGDYRAKRWDERGLHPYSVEWGRIFAFEVALPELGNMRWSDPEGLDPVAMRRRARVIAEIEFRDQIIEERRREGAESRVGVDRDVGGGDPGVGAGPAGG